MSLRSKKVFDLEELGCRLAKTSHQDFEKEYLFSTSKIFYLEYGAVSARSKKILDLEELGCRLTTTSHQYLDCSRIALMRYNTFEKIPILELP